MKQGVFWMIPKDKGDFELIHRFDDTRGHSEIWEEVVAEYPALRKYDYEHFPRGRVWIKDGKATVFLDEKINMRNILEKIARIFCLNGDYEIQTV